MCAGGNRGCRPRYGVITSYSIHYTKLYDDFRQLAQQGIQLVGRTQGFDNGVATFQDDLADNIRAGDANYLSLLDSYNFV